MLARDNIYRHQWRYLPPTFAFKQLMTLMSIVFIITVHMMEPIEGNRIQCSSMNSSVTEIHHSEMKYREVNMTFLTSIAKRGKGKRFAGAFFVALEDLQKDANDSNIPVNFTHGFYDIGQDEINMMRTMVDVHSMGFKTVFVGPESFCEMAGPLATALEIPLMAFNCEDTHNDTGDYSMVNTDPSIAHACKYIADMMEGFGWKSYWLISGTYVKWLYAANELKNITETRKNISLNGETRTDLNDHIGGDYFKQNGTYEKIVTDTKKKTRVYVYLGEAESLIYFLRELQDQGVTDAGLHVVVALDEKKVQISTTQFYLSSERKGKTKRKRKAFRHTLLIQPEMNINSAQLQDFNKRVSEWNTRKPISLPVLDTSRLPFLRKFSKVQASLPKETYYLYDATMIYGKAVMDLMSREGADPTDATQIICHIRKSQNYTSVLGTPIEFLSNGESRISYIVHAFTDNNEYLQEDFKKVGHFDTNNCNCQDCKIKNERFCLQESIYWVNDLPSSEPKSPKSKRKSDTTIILATIVPLSVIVICIIMVVWKCKHMKYERRLNSAEWKINPADITNTKQMNEGEFMSLARPKKKNSLKSNDQYTELLSNENDLVDTQPEAATLTEDIILMGTYKGSNDVVIKQLSRKNVDVNNKRLKEQLHIRKEMTHENINRFYGACIDPPPTVQLVSMYCIRKSLKDILGEPYSYLDDMFKTSLVHDLIKGMSFIHGSDLCWHGNLKSSNCLVDSRWTLKISDFGFSALGPAPRTLSFNERLYKKLLWTAPELLYCRFNSCTSSSSNSYHRSNSHPPPLHNNHSNVGVHNPRVASNHCGIQAGDVYSFAIILFELYGKSGPWGLTKLTDREIIEKLISAEEPYIRPDLRILKCDENIKSLIELCWIQQSDSRPNFNEINSKFKPIKQKYLKSNIMDNMMSMMEKYSKNLEGLVAERTVELNEEKKRTENLLLRMLPRSVADILIKGHPVTPEQFECVTIYFSDIVGFTQLSAETTPMEVVNFLNELYTLFDSIIERCDVYKVETIGDAYMVVSGLPNKNGDSHAAEIASMSLMILKAIHSKIFASTKSSVKLRIGIHSGPCCAGVVGLKMPRYCLFGDTVNTANRMESTGEALKIHCSQECKEILDKLGGFQLEERGYTHIKGKGQLCTYFLLSEDEEKRQRRLCHYNRGKRCVSISNLDYNNSFKVERRAISSLSANQRQSVNATNLSLSESSQQLRNSQFEKNTYPHTGAMDSNCSELADDLNPDIRCNSLSRAPLNMRQSNTCSLNMSPIVEDPSSPDESHNWIKKLSRTSQPTSERDSLLSCNALSLTSCGQFPSRRISENKINFNSVGTLEEKSSLMNPETIL